MDELLNSAEVPAEQLAVSVDNAQLYAEYHRLAAEQAALRRVATLVARGVEPSEVFDAVTTEMCRCVGAVTAGLWRYDTTGEIRVVSGTYLRDGAVKCRWALEHRSRATTSRRWCNVPAALPG
jgi:GAF domain-containing protein